MDCADLKNLLEEFKNLGIPDQIDYQKFYLYSIITHSTAIEGSTVSEIENQLMFDEGITPAGHDVAEQMMNLDVKMAYEKAWENAKSHTDISVDSLCELSALVMANTGGPYNSMAGSFDSSKGELRLLNVSAGHGGRSYLDFKKVPERLDEFCNWLNEQRACVDREGELDIYELSFLAHYRLVTIHPWADGNGRMSRLVMNQIQHEFNLQPTIIYKEHKKQYIESLAKSREEDNSGIFCAFMFEELKYYLQNTIAEYKESISQ